MKIVTFTMVNNESEIIESFIRYNYNFVDLMVIIDNGCTDNTIIIIKKLIDEGFKIKIYDESLEPYNQFKLDNKYLNKIIDELKPDLILPLDADEFIVAEENPREALEQLSLDRIYYVYWQWFVITKNDDAEEGFIPRRMKYCLEFPAWNISDGTPVTKAIIPAQYFKKMQLTLSMGHHFVFGNKKAKIEHIEHIKFAHYRAISVDQFVYKTSCYTMRDISTMDNNVETAQRTNQMALIEAEEDMWNAAEEASYCGYERKISYMPISLKYCVKNQIEIKYKDLARESVSNRILQTGREMAIRVYNLEREKQENGLLKPIILWLDGIKGKEYLIPAPSNKLTYLTQMYNVRGYLTTENKIRYLKVNYRLIVTPDVVKFLPHEYIVIPDTVNYKTVKKELILAGIDKNIIISLKEYKKRLGIGRNIYSLGLFVPGMINRTYKYVQRNGISATYKKIIDRVSHK